MKLAFLENAFIRGSYTHAYPHFLSRPRQKGITHSPRQHSFENLFPPTAERGGRNYDLLYQDSIKQYEDDLEQ